MDGILSVIQKTYDILQTPLIFGQYRFSLFAVMITFACISLTAYFFGKLFESR